MAQLPTTYSYITEPTPFELDSNTTPTYPDIVAYYEQYADHPQVHISEVGKTDSGHPLHEVVISADGVHDPEAARTQGKAVILVNNGIHPGEPCGIDASMLLLKQLLTTEQHLLQHTTVVIVPVYNIGGCLNRSSTSRANQVGPAAYGFRGNAKNLDLNRDFVKCDSGNARAFAQIFHKWQPQILMDNHTSNGADYQYTMTLIPTQKDKLDAKLAGFMTKQLLPDLYKHMANNGYKMTPYVYSMGSTPDGGIKGFMDYPRYSSGYAAMHHCISFMPETHMLKPYADRVLSTLLLMKAMLRHMGTHHATIIANHQAAIAQAQRQEVWPLQYELDSTVVDTIIFDGYEPGQKASAVTGADRLYYDRSKPYSKSIPHYNTYRPTLTIERPTAYLIPQAYTDVVELLRLNGVIVNRLPTDTTHITDMYYIQDYSSTSRPYEAHYLHYDVEVSTKTLPIRWQQGDFIVYTAQPKASYIIQTLEPQGPDSYFAWNYFDGILMQKEHYSAYVWEDLAADLLARDANLRTALDDKKANDQVFAKSPRMQLDFIYSQSPYYEDTYLRYPVGRVVVK